MAIKRLFFWGFAEEDDNKRCQWTEDQTDDPPEKSAAILALREAGIDKGERTPTDQPLPGLDHCLVFFHEPIPRYLKPYINVD